MSTNRLFLSTLIGIIALDQITKYVAVQAGIGQLNQGISFGVVATEMQLLLASVILLVMVGLWWWLQQLWHEQPVPAGLFFGGGLSNVIDRLVFGGVRDWLPIPFVTLTNNLADWSIAIAILVLVVIEVKHSLWK